MENKKNSLGKSILLALKKRLKPGYILFIILLISANAFAWFIYMDKISSDINVKVKSWNVSFKLDNQEMSDYINFTVSDIYPGMTPFQESISVTNDGETSARLTYEIISLKVFNDVYTIEDGTLTEDNLKQIMQDNYPFKINITTNQEVINASGGTARFYINVTWPYESVNSSGVSNDQQDTYWGNKAYEFISTRPNTPCIIVRVKLSAVQVQS